MAGKKRRQTGISTTLRKKHPEIWAAGDTNKWAQFAKMNNTRNAVIRAKGGSVAVNCFRGHTDSDPSLHIVPGKGMAHCFSCNYTEFDPIRFWAGFMQKTESETLKLLQEFYGVKFVKPNELKEVEADARRAEYKKWLATCFNSELLNAINAWYQVEEREEEFAKGEYYYAADSIKYLKGRLLLNDCHMLPIGMYPTRKKVKELAEKACDLQGKKLFGAADVQRILEYITFTKPDKSDSDPSTGGATDPFYLGALVFTYHVTPNDVSRFRLKITRETRDKGIVEIPDPGEEKLGFFGLGTYPREEIKKVIIVEGEFDQAQWAAQAARVGNADYVVLAHGGAAYRDFADLKAIGVEEIGYIGDFDDGGITSTKEVLKLNHDFKIRIFNWPQGILDPAKAKTDLDDSLKIYGFQAVYDAINDWDRNWVKPEYWVKQQIEREIKDKDLEDDPDVMAGLVLSYAPCIGTLDDSDQARAVKNFLTTTLVEYGLPTNDATSICNDFLAKDSVEEVFISRVVGKLRERFDFVGIDRSKTVLPVKIWDKKKRYLVDLRMGNDSMIKASLGALVGCVRDWVRTELSVPDFIKYITDMKTGERTERSVVAQEEDCVKYSILALRRIIVNLPGLDNFKKISTGNHYLPTTTGDQLFCVNGPDVFKLQFDNKGMPNWEQLESPVYERYMFETAGKKWSQYITLDNLRRQPTMTIRDRITMFEAILNQGFTFENQETEPLGLAAFGVGSTTMCLFKHNPQLLAAAERSSGKTTLYAELFGGAKGTRIHLVEHSRFVDAGTPAGIRQSMDGVSLTFIHDEFDNRSGGKAQREKMDQVMALLRASSGGEGAFAMGTKDGSGREYILDFPAMVAGIHPDITEANMTRFFTTDLKTGLDGRKPPAESIFEMFTPEQLEALKMSITLDSYWDIPSIQRSYNLVLKACADDPSILEGAKLQRFRDTLQLFCAYLCAAGLDWQSWAKKIILAKGDHLRMLTSQNFHEKIIATLIYHPAINLPDFGNRRVSLSHFFSKANVYNEVEALNNSGSGLYLYEHLTEKKWYVLVNWTEAMGGILRGTSVAQQIGDPLKIRAVVQHHHLAVSDSEFRRIYDSIPAIQACAMDIPTTLLDITKLIDKQLQRNLRAQEEASRRIRRENGLDMPIQDTVHTSRTPEPPQTTH